MALFRRNIDPGQPLSASIGFKAQSVLVDNYTAFWLYFQDADAYVPPFYVGVVLVLEHTTDYARFDIKSPFGAQPTPVVTSYFVHTVWSPDPNFPSPGALVNDSINNTTTPPLPVVVTNQVFGGVSFAVLTDSADHQDGTADGSGNLTVDLNGAAYDGVVDSTGAYTVAGHGLPDGKLVAPEDGNYRVWVVLKATPATAADNRIQIDILKNGVVHLVLANDLEENFTQVGVAGNALPYYALALGVHTNDLFQVRVTVKGANGDTWQFKGLQFGLELIGPPLAISTVGVQVRDEDVVQGTANILDFQGAGVTASVAQNKATIVITAGSGAPQAIECAAEALIDANVPTTNFADNGNVGQYLGAFAGKNLMQFPLTGITVIQNAWLIITVIDFNNCLGINEGTNQYIECQRLLRTDINYTQCTYNIYKTGSNWNTAGANGLGTDYTRDWSSYDGPFGDNVGGQGNRVDLFTGAVVQQEVINITRMMQSVIGVLTNLDLFITARRTTGGQNKFTIASRTNATTLYRPRILYQ